MAEAPAVAPPDIDRLTNLTICLISAHDRTASPLVDLAHRAIKPINAIMIFISITRLRLRSIRFLPGFLIYASRSLRQCKRMPGFGGGSLLADRKLTFWTMTLWTDQSAMRAYVASGAHLKAMPKLRHWCDEASLVHWTQNHPTPPTWPEAAGRMRTAGRASKINHPSPDHATLSFPSPRTTSGVPIAAHPSATEPKTASHR